MTLVVPRRDEAGVSDLVSAGLSTIALRAPDHPVARALLSAAQRPIAAPSANRSGHVSATRAGHVAADLGDKAAVILDGGPTTRGLELTVLSLAGETPVLLRPGAIPAEAIEKVIGAALARGRRNGGIATSPGQLQSHYAPRARLRLNASNVANRTRRYWRSAQSAHHPARAIINLSPSGDLVEAAANLFAALRELDASGAETIAVTPVPTHGLGEAINDRLERAAAPRG